MSSTLLGTVTKHLNVAQVYTNGKGYIIENRGKDLLDVLKSMENIHIVDQSVINEKVQNVIGSDFDIICEYLDSKRDRDTLKAILTKITSAKFMARLEDVRDKHSFQRLKHQVDLNIQLFKDMKNDLEKNAVTGKAERKNNYRMLQKIKLKKLRHVFQGRGRMLKLHLVKKPRQTWRKITLPDQNWSGLAHNAITSMAHLFMETELQWKEEVDEDCYYSVKRSGAPAILLNLSYFEPETVQRDFNEIFLLLNNPALYKHFRNSDTDKLKGQIDYFMVGEHVQFLCTSCERLQMNE